MTSTAFSVGDDLALVDDATDALLRTASGLTDQDVFAASLCEGWTRGHVLTHISRNAEAMVRLTRWASTGEPQEMYPGGTERRDADIEAGAGRTSGEQLTDLRETAASLAEAFPLLLGDLPAPEVEMRGGYRVGSATLPFLRLRELVLHHVDLDAGYTLAEVDGPVLVRLLDDAVGRLRLSHRAPSLTLATHEGETWQVGEGEVEVTGTRHAMLLWLARRIPTGVTSRQGLPELPRGA